MPPFRGAMFEQLSIVLEKQMFVLKTITEAKICD